MTADNHITSLEATKDASDTIMPKTLNVLISEMDAILGLLDENEVRLAYLIRKQLSDKSRDMIASSWYNRPSSACSNCGGFDANDLTEDLDMD